MKKKSNEFTINCPLYLKKLESCPSGSKNHFILTLEDEEKLFNQCTSEKYKNCQIYLGYSEKAA